MGLGGRAEQECEGEEGEREGGREGEMESERARICRERERERERRGGSGDIGKRDGEKREIGPFCLMPLSQ